MSSAWRAAVRRWHAQTCRPSHFGSANFWEKQYVDGHAAKEWFLPADTAAASTAAALGTHERAHAPSRIGAYAKVLHVGCGVSQLGTALVSALASEPLRLSARIMNTDISPAAIAAAAAAVGPWQQEQNFCVWDAASETPPPALPSPLYSCGASSRFDLVVDKGTLDALTFADADGLIGYLASVRACLRSRAVDSAVPPLYVHFSDDPPEVRGELLHAAFPSTGGASRERPHGRERWRVASSLVTEDELIDNDASKSGASVEAPTTESSSSSGGDGGCWTYYRYTVYCDL